MIATQFQRLLFLFLSLFTVFHVETGVHCAPVDDDGTLLLGSQESGNLVMCPYKGAGPCTYSTDSLNCSSCMPGQLQGRELTVLPIPGSLTDTIIPLPTITFPLGLTNRSIILPTITVPHVPRPEATDITIQAPG
ncbi:hypothetical protein E4T56_gene15774, partial [Termitomyces sp. T112]